LSLQRRVGGPWGHLNNQQTCQLLHELDLSVAQRLIVGHISQKNNSLDCVKGALSEFLNTGLAIDFASQDAGFGWVTLHAEEIATAAL
jgi:phosphoribosyl 1,2-cyclic phosphodiesterase